MLIQAFGSQWGRSLQRRLAVMADNLDAFLGGKTEPNPPAAPEAATAPAETAAPDTAGGAQKPPEPPQADPEDADPPEPAEGEAVVPRRALEDERHKRQDWKRQAVEAQTQRDELRKQLEEAKRQASQPPPQPVQQPPQPQIRYIDPTQDPIGFAAQVQQLADQRAAERAHHMNANWSEFNLRKELGDAKVDELITEFKQAAEADPSLYDKLHQQRDPYGWAHKQLELLRTMREIGNDPAAYRARIIAEAQAEAARAAPVPPPVSPAAGQPPSLATARSVAGRSAPTFTGPPALEDILRRA
jgi:hypothetical protein